MGFKIRRVGAVVIALRAGPVGIKAEFAAWYFDPQREGTQREWAQAHQVHPTTLSIWKSEPWMRALADKWSEEYDASFGEVARALYLRATDIAHPQGIQAARLLAELLGQFPTPKAAA